MDRTVENNPQDCASKFFLQHPVHRKHGSKRSQVSGIQILIHQVQSRACYRQRKQRSYERNRAPTCSRPPEADSGEFPTSQEQKKNRCQVPNENRVIKWNMTDAHRCCDQVREKRQAGVRLEKFSSRWVERGIKKLFDTRQVDFRVFRIGMVSMNSQCCQREQQQSKRGVPLRQCRKTCAPEVVT